MTNNNDTTDQVLAKQVASARNYLYEATMGDYSQGSIDRGVREYNAIKQECLDRGLDYEELAKWNEVSGCFKAVDLTEGK